VGGKEKKRGGKKNISPLPYRSIRAFNKKDGRKRGKNQGPSISQSSSQLPAKGGKKEKVFFLLPPEARSMKRKKEKKRRAIKHDGSGIHRQRLEKKKRAAVRHYFRRREGGSPRAFYFTAFPPVRKGGIGPRNSFTRSKKRYVSSSAAEKGRLSSLQVVRQRHDQKKGKKGNRNHLIHASRHERKKRGSG